MKAVYVSIYGAEFSGKLELTTDAKHFIRDSLFLD